jgi:hypothetical protein
MKLKFEELAVHRRAALGLLSHVQDPEYARPMVFSELKSSRRYQFLDVNALTITLSGGYRLCRTTRSFSLPGQVYWEIDFKSANTNESHIRCGIATLNADLEAPVGYDEHGYSVRDLGGAFHKAHRSPAAEFSVGDVVGLGFDGSRLSLWINGEGQGVLFEGIDSNVEWMPAVSIYYDAEVVGRFVRPFRFDPGAEWKAAGDLPPGEPRGVFTSRDLVKWMRTSLEVGEYYEAACRAIHDALTPAHQMPM